MIEASLVQLERCAVSPQPVRMLGGRAPHETFFGFLRSIDWLKIYPNLVVFAFLFFSYFPHFFFVALKTSNLVERATEITIKYKYEIAQSPAYHYTLL